MQSSRNSQRRPRQRWRPQFESLEGRQLLSSVVSDAFGMAARALNLESGRGIVAVLKSDAYAVSQRVGQSHSGANVYGRSSGSLAPMLVRMASARPNPVTGTSVTLAVQATEVTAARQISNTPGSPRPSPSGASPPIFSINGSNAAKNTRAILNAAGTYRFRVTIVNSAGLTISSFVNVVAEAGVLQHTARSALHRAAFASKALNSSPQPQGISLAERMIKQPKFTWKSSGGRTYIPWALHRADDDGQRHGHPFATAMGRSFEGGTTVTVIPSLGDPQIRSLILTLDADGWLDHGDLMQILLTVGNEDGVVDATEFNDLKTLVADASIFHIPGYVAALAGIVVDGNPANAHYQGQPLGNLNHGSSTTILHDLVDKWFLGTDHPAVTSTDITYQTVAGSLFVTEPSYTNMFQGNLGDCYLIATLGALAKSNPSVIENMIIPNDDNTWTVRFYESDSTHRLRNCGPHTAH